MKRIFFFLLFLFFVTPSVTYAQSTPTDKLIKYKAFNSVPRPNDVVIYQINIRTFSQTGDFQGILSRLDSIKALGINVIYLMPIFPIGKEKSINSPYCIRDYKSVNPEFGNVNDLRELVVEVHKRKMSIILDWVANHTSYDHVWTKNKSWYLLDSVGKICSPPGTGWNDIAQLNFKNEKMRTEMISAMKYWITDTNVDGFRCDYADGPPFDFWKQAIDSLRGIPNHKLLLLAEGKRSDHYKAGFDFNFGFSFFENLKEIYKKGQSVKKIDSVNATDYIGATKGQQIVRYTTNHDVNSSDGTPEELFDGHKGSMAAFVIASYMKGVPMIYNGQEVGLPYRLTFPFTGEKIKWNINPEVTAEYKKLITLRLANKSITTGNLTSFNSDDVCAFKKATGKDEVLVIVNLRNKIITYTVPANLQKSSWKDLKDKSVRTLNSSLELAPYSYLILQK
jgi:glycosidase